MYGATGEDAIENQAEELAEDEIVERIFEAIIDHRLPPGSKLSEPALCEAFGVGRMRIRRSLLLLSSREVVELLPKRGAFVASPTAEQAREVFEARLTIEPNVARLAVGRATEADVRLLEEHLHLEEKAHLNGRRRDAIRLSGQFHVLLAQVAANGVMLRMVKELVTRTSLIIGLFGGTGMSNCRDDDHAELLTTIRAGDADRAEQLMKEHLEHIQEHLDLGGHHETPMDLVSLFRK